MSAITYRDSSGQTWCYYLRLTCSDCGPAASHHITPDGSTLRCGHCRKVSHISDRPYAERI